MFSDEKKFNLDGPDGYAFYWADDRLDEQYFSRGQNGGGRVVIWGAFSYHGTAQLAAIHQTMNADRYIEVLSNYMILFAEKTYEEGWIFQHEMPDHTVPT